MPQVMKIFFRGVKNELQPDSSILFDMNQKSYVKKILLADNLKAYCKRFF